MKPRTEILISGFGGQGVIRMALILGRCAVDQGHRVTMLKSHGTETRGGYVRAQLVISPDFVDSPVVESADLFVAFSAPAYRKFYGLCSGKVLYDPEMVEEIHDDAADRHVEVSSRALAREHFDNVLFANMVMLGALTRLAAMNLEVMKAVMVQVIPRAHEQNLQALDLGHGLEVVAGSA
ncbi:MAG: 2-oxoacid:acceptor oxidoreductase family protein [Alphaproteobacteria bacterium]|jgi:2-oxoglutarate ferredoxin oxidoreductase subunit gamma|nr:2-oxoacid:acceptor oxidoreductase family protein [Alphaproteobacteria bacterium]